MTRVDAREKATGEACYTNDVVLPGMVWAAVARSTSPRARITRVDATDAVALPGVLGVFTAADLEVDLYGRGVRDVPVLAGDEVRYVGERVVAVVAETRDLAEEAASLVVVEYAELEAVTSPAQALAPGAPLVHTAPWDYPRAKVTPEDGPNTQSVTRHGDPNTVDRALTGAAFAVDQTYATPSGHQGYLEPHACVADFSPTGKLKLWLTNKSPYRARSQVAECLDLDPDDIEIEPVKLGGDFGGKGSLGDAPLCAALSRLVHRPVKMALRYSEDLTSVALRHSSQTRVRAGCGPDGQLLAIGVEMVMDGGAYAGFKPAVTASLHGSVEIGSYRLPTFCLECRIVYTNTVPKGHMRAPGAPQLTFALESALDELASACGISPEALRRVNLLRTGEADAHGDLWVEHRGGATLDAALDAVVPRKGKPGWLVGTGLSVYSRKTLSDTSTSLRLSPTADGVRVEVGMVETGTGSHTVARELISQGLGFDPDQVEVVQVPTSSLPRDPGVGGSWVTSSLALAADDAVKAWRSRLDEEPILVEVEEHGGPQIGSYGVQIAQVAVDPDTGELDVLEILTAVDIGAIVNDVAHQIQIDGGAVMGYGFACLEDSDESDGQVWAANLGEFKIASARDVPCLKTVLLPGGVGIGTAEVKSIGELTTPPTAAAIANAVAAATSQRVRELPITAERIYNALHGGAA